MDSPGPTNILKFFSGNPANEVKTGYLELFKLIDNGIYEYENFENDAKYGKESLQLDHSEIYTRYMCVLFVPSFMIPGDILNFFCSYFDSIFSIRILRHYYSQERYLALITLESSESAESFQADFHMRSMTSLEPIPCLIYAVKSIVFDESPDTQLSRVEENRTNIYNTSPSFLNAQLKKCVDTKENMNELHLPTRVSSPPTTLSTPDNIKRIVTDNINIRVHENTVDDTSICALCLDVISRSRPRSFISCCNHEFHINCIGRMQGVQCPVCRYVGFIFMYKLVSTNYMISSACSACVGFTMNQMLLYFLSALFVDGREGEGTRYSLDVGGTCGCALSVVLWDAAHLAPTISEHTMRPSSTHMHRTPRLIKFGILQVVTLCRLF